jgi:hypothetical protein
MKEVAAGRIKVICFTLKPNSAAIGYIIGKQRAVAAELDIKLEINELKIPIPKYWTNLL